MSDLTDRAYLQLTPRERFRAALSASARHDTYELDRLFATCEKKLYRMDDDDFTRPLRKFGLMANAQKAWLMRALVGILLTNLLAAYAEEDGAEANSIYAGIDRARAGIKAAMEAWDSFCLETGLSDEELESFRGIAEDEMLSFALSLIELDEVEADDAARLKHLSRMRAQWGRLASGTG